MRLTLLLLLGVSAPSLLASASSFDDHRLSTLRGDSPGSSFGAAVASAGDVNGDGFPDLVVGAPDRNGTAGARSGAAYLFLGSVTGYGDTPSWSAEGELALAQFGRAVASAGDVNGDGFDDVVIGSPGFDPPNPDHARLPGRLYVYLGSAQGLATTPTLVAEGRPYDLGYREGIGSAVASGDFNGDGFADVVGAQHAKYLGDSRVYYGARASLAVDRFTSVAPYASYSGSSVTVADLNGDGFDDLFFAHVLDRNDFSTPPLTVVYLGSPAGLPEPPPPGERPTPAFLLENWALAARLGDLDRDGFDDLVTALGDPVANEVPYHTFFRGSATGPIEVAAERSPVLGVPGRLTPLGDINGDGFADVVTDDGRSFYMYFGSNSGFRSTSDGMGGSGPIFAAVGDVDRDGFDDFAAGDAAHDRVDLYRGGTDWRFPVVADLSVEMYYADGTFWMTVRNAGPDTVRARLVDLLPASLRRGWGCYTPTGGVAAQCMSLAAVLPPQMDSLLTISPGAEAGYFLGTGASLLPFTNTVSLVLPDWVTDPDLANNRVSVTIGPQEEPLFADGFESGTLAAWSAHPPQGLTVRRAAALEGAFGLRVLAPAFGSAVLRDDTPADERAYHARFRFDASHFGEARPRGSLQGTLFRGLGATPLFEVLLERRGRQLFLSGRAWTDAGFPSPSPAVALADGPHVLDVAWRRASDAAAGDGAFVVQLDGVEIGALSALDNDAVGGLESVELGLTLRAFVLPLGPRRTVRVDSFASWRLN